MNWTALLCLAITIIILVISCKTPKLDLQNVENPIIEFGSGGGMTGARQVYYLDKKGHLFVAGSEADSYDYLTKIPSKRMKEINTRIIELDIANIRFSNPGNYYKFLAVNANNKPNRIVWSGQGSELPDGVPDFYKSLRNLIPNE